VVFLQRNRRLQIAALTLLVGAAQSAVAPRVARACSPLPQFSVELSTKEIPSDGLLIGKRSCTECLQELHVQDDTGKEVLGKLVSLPQLSSEWFAFRPDTPWTLGKRYRVYFGVTEHSAAEVTIVAGTTGPLAVKAMFGSATRSAGGISCLKYDYSRLGGLCGPPMFYTSKVTEAVINLTVSGALASQRLYRAQWSADGKEISSGDFAGPLGVRKTFDGTPSSVCYELFALDPVTGVQERLSGECQGTSNLGVREGLTGEMEYTLRSCLEPPKGYEERWCKAALAGADKDCSEVCKLAQERCGKDHVLDSDAGQADHADAGVASTTHAHDDAEQADDQATDRVDGCSVGAAANASLPGWFAIVALSLVARRRKKQA
jgi:MYXO-CTERM domain-containing protein